MIKVNLLGKKRGTQISQTFEQLSSKVGLPKFENIDIKAYTDTLLKVVIIAAGLYLGHYIPNDIVEKKVQRLDVQLSEMAKREQQLQTELNSKKEIRKQMERLEQEEQELKRQLTIISSLSQDRDTAFQTINNLTTMIPNMVWLDNLSFDKQTVSLKGDSWDYFAINSFLRVLNESVIFGAVTLRSMSSTGAAVSGLTLPPGVLADALPKLKTFEMEMLIKKKI